MNDLEKANRIEYLKKLIINQPNSKWQYAWQHELEELTAPEN